MATDKEWDEVLEREADRLNAEAAEAERQKGFAVTVSYKAAFEDIQRIDADLLAMAGRVADHSGFDGGIRECTWEEPTIEAASGMRRRIESTDDFKAMVREL